MDVKYSRAGLSAFMTSPTLGRILEERINTAAMLYQSQVAKNTGRLAASAHTSVAVQPVFKGLPRLVGTLTVGGPGPLGDVDYAASHEMGHDVRNAHGEIVGYSPPAHDLNRVLNLIGYM